MSTIYELTEDYLRLLELAEDPDTDPEAFADTLEGLEGEIEIKAEAPKKDPNTPITAKQVLTLKMMCKKHEMPESKILRSTRKRRLRSLRLVTGLILERPDKNS
jgi:hypothetical protein